jgi:cytochrome c peroxidase
MPKLSRSLAAAGLLPLFLGSMCTTWSPPANWVAQGWTQEQTLAWYTASQGSRLIPRAWLDHLEQPDSEKPFLDAAYIASFRYLPGPAIPNAAADACGFDAALPLGFVVDCQSDAPLSNTKLRWKTAQSDNEPWVGMNCSACHTATLSYGGNVVRIEGGPTLADFQGMTEKMELSLANTATDPAKFARFSAAVLGGGATQADTAMLQAALGRLNAWNASLASLNQTGLRYGYGRLDAIGHIFNKAALLAMPLNGADQSANPSDAPVSYPFLWNVTQLNKVEWNGLADNIPLGDGVDVGALGRNAGEVIGVFGDVTIAKPAGPLTGYASSLHMKTLVQMEQQIYSLQPPKWPAAFPALDSALVEHGRQVFVSARCDTCHSIPAATWQATDRYTVQLIPAFASSAAPPPRSLLDQPTNTDIWMACNTALDRARTGAFKTADADFGGLETTAAEAFNVSLVKNAVIGTILAQKDQVVTTGLAGVFGLSRGLPPPHIGQVLAQGTDLAKQQRKTACLHYAKPAQIVYKARPLQGIWATAPYLHNGSVVSLYELLLPPAQRRSRFFTGTNMFDPKQVGLDADAAAPGNSFAFDTTLEGNANTGHDYGNAALSDEDRWSLVEYMKSL